MHSWAECPEELTPRVGAATTTGVLARTDLVTRTPDGTS